MALDSDPKTTDRRKTCIRHPTSMFRYSPIWPYTAQYGPIWPCIVDQGFRSAAGKVADALDPG